MKFGFEGQPKQEKIKVIINGREYSFTPEEYEEHVKAQERGQELKQREEQKESLGKLIESLKRGEKPERENDEEAAA